LRSVVADVPKVLAPVRGRPFLAYLLDQLADAGARHVVLCTGYRGDLVERAFGQSYRTLEIDFSRETTPLGTGGALRLALRAARSSTVLAMNGDSYCDVDLKAFHARHQASGYATSLVLTEVTDTSRYGHVQVAPDGRVHSFDEKGARQGPGWINAGSYFLDAEVLADACGGASAASERPMRFVSPGESVSLERDLLPRWIDRGLGGFPCRGKFLDIGTPESFIAAERFFGHCAAASA
jgi:D-glycero-alpha-D-manno-heptose 1-phosphate guanylyltransferase